MHFRTARFRFTRLGLLAAIAFTLTVLLGFSSQSPVFGAASASLDQCANDPVPSPNTDGCIASASDWVSGNVGASKSNYLEGDSIPYRLVMDGLSIGSHTVVIEWDTTKGDKHAIDYVTTYNATVTTANPCLGVSSACGAASTWAIPKDPQVDNGAGSPITQKAGNFTLFGGTISSVGVPAGCLTFLGSYCYNDGLGFIGNKSARISITFTASQANPVLAWGGHIAQRRPAAPTSPAFGWGDGSSAVAISGSPYHTRLVSLDGSGGNQDRSLSADAVTFPSSITIIKDATPSGATSFPFTATPNPPLSNFNLVDDGTAANTKSFTGITNFQTYTIVESMVAGWTLSFDAQPCTVADANGGTQTANLASRNVTISLKEGENVTCTFKNVAVPGLQIKKTADVSPVNAGDNIGFMITVTSSGLGTANNVHVSDNLPNDPGLSWTINPPVVGCSIGAGPTLTCNFATLPGGASQQIHVVSPTTFASCGTIQNSATASATSITAVSSQASVAVNCPDLSIVKTADAASVPAGSQIGFTITVTNNGPGMAKDVTLNDPLPTGTDISWSIVPSVAGCTINGGVTLVCNFGDLGVGASRSVKVSSPTTINSCKAYANTASAQALNHPQVQAQATTTVLCSPKLEITKVADPGPVNAGEQIGFTITVKNTGAAMANNVLVNDILANNAGLSWTMSPNVPGCTLAGNVLNCTFATLAAGASQTIHVISPTTFASCATIQNTASASATNIITVTAQASVTVNCPDLIVTKTADAASVVAGNPIGFTITVTNAGPGTAKAVMLSDALPTGTGITWSLAAPAPGCTIAANSLTCSFGDLAAGTNKSVHITSPTTAAAGPAGSCGAYPNTAQTQATNHPQVQAQATANVTCSAALQVTKTADAGTVNAGETIGFTITVTNNGVATANDVQIDDVLPAGTGISWTIDPAVSGCSITAGSLNCTYATLAAGANNAVHITSPTTGNGCAAYTNTATAQATGVTSVTSQPASVTVNCPSLAITKTADAASVAFGNTIGFTITVTNGGPGSAKAVSLVDVLPAGTGISWSISPAAAGCSITSGTLNCAFGDLANAASRSVHVISPTTAQSCASYPNTASAQATNQAAVQSQATATVTCALAALTIVKSASPVGAQSFSFTGDGGLGEFSLIDDGTASRQKQFSNLGAGTYVITEASLTGWQLNSIACTNSSPTSLTTRSVTVTLAAGDSVTCTFSNAQIVAPIVVPPNIFTPPLNPSPPINQPTSPPSNPPSPPTSTPPTTTTTTTTTTSPTRPVNEVEPVTSDEPVNEVAEVQELPNTGTGGPAASPSGGYSSWLLALMVSMTGAVAAAALRFRRHRQ